MTAVNKTPGYRNLLGLPGPLNMVSLPVQAGSTQEIRNGEICKLRSLTDLSTYPIIPATADDGDFIPVIAWQEQKAGDVARKIKFVIPTPIDLFEFSLNAATTVKPGKQLEIHDSQTLKAGTSNVMAVAYDFGAYLDANGDGRSVTTVWAQFCAVSASGLNQFPFIGTPAQVSVLNGLGQVIADPGTGEAIPVTESGQIALTIAASATETNTVAAPAEAGLELLISAVAVGASGTRAITFAAAIDGTNDVVTFDEAGDYIRVMSIQTGASTYAWRKVAGDAATSAS